MTTVLLPDLSIDTGIRDALTAFAAMLRDALDAYGLTTSLVFGVDVPDVSPESTPLALTVLAAGDHSVNRETDCLYQVTARVHAMLLLAPTGSDRAAMLGATVDWLIPVLRAVEQNQSLGLPDLVQSVIPTSWQAFSAAEWAGTAYTGLQVTADLTLLIGLPAQD